MSLGDWDVAGLAALKRLNLSRFAALDSENVSTARSLFSPLCDVLFLFVSLYFFDTPPPPICNSLCDSTPLEFYSLFAYREMLKQRTKGGGAEQQIEEGSTLRRL